MHLHRGTVTNFYQLLGVSHAATKKEIRAAYLKLAKIHHPDAKQQVSKTETSTAAIEDHFKAITNAYETLINDESRQNYNRSLFLKVDDYHGDYREYAKQKEQSAEVFRTILRRHHSGRFGEMGGVSEDFTMHEKQMRNRRRMNRHFIWVSIVLFFAYRFSVFVMLKRREEAERVKRAEEEQEKEKHQQQGEELQRNHI